MTERGGPDGASILQPGATIGILGGGQLGRMLALSAAHLGLHCHIYCPDAASPAFDVARQHTIAGYDDDAALARFARQCDVITYEFENVPAHTAATLSAHAAVYPGSKALGIAQDRLLEKNFLHELGLPVAPFHAVASLDDLRAALERICAPAVLKTRRFGYDGKGQFVIRQPTQAAEAWDAIGMQPAILEGFVDFSKEISVLIARGRDGKLAAYDPPENEHREQILRTSRVPARIDPAVAAKAVHIGRSIATALDYVGLLAVELFVAGETGLEALLVNEIAPRVHNSGHWTMDACLTSQFEQHIRAIAGWPLGTTARHSDVIMENLIGEDVTHWHDRLAEPHAGLHLYGKTDTRPGRKMGHVNHLTPLSGKSS